MKNSYKRLLGLVIASVLSVSVITAAADSKSDDAAKTNTAAETVETTDTADTSDKPARKLGDVTGDGNITSEDALDILRIYVNLGEYDDEQKAAADIDGDGSATPDDSLIALRVSVSIEDIDTYINK